MHWKLKFVCILGCCVVLLPLIGIPRSVKDIVLFVVGGILILLSFILRKNLKLLKLKLKRLEGQQGTLVQ